MSSKNYMTNRNKTRHLIKIDDLTNKEVEQIFGRAEFFLGDVIYGKKTLSTLKGKTLINLFFENSTRTRTSFELAAKRLGAEVVNIQTENSSVKKGKTLEDTCLTIDAMKPDFLVIRHNASGMAARAAEIMSCPVINAGDGCFQHPTQGLLDAFVINCRKGKIKDLKVVICGDIMHSRVARSNISLLTRLGAKVTAVAPSTLMPSAIESLEVTVGSNLQTEIKNADALIMLRLQNERMNGGFIPSEKDYFSLYGLTEEMLGKAKRNMLVLHPGPINRGVELEGSLASNRDKTEILNQVEAGVAVRMSVLEMLA